MRLSWTNSKPSFMAMSRCIRQGPVANVCSPDSEAGQWKAEMENGQTAGLLVFVGWESYRYTARIDEIADARKHGHEVLRTLDETLARLVDAETGQRGYLLTGDEGYLEPYREAIKNLDQVTGQLKALTSGQLNQRKRILALEPLIEKKVAELQMTIDLRRK